MPTLPKLVLYLSGVKDWEEFGVFLLPEDEIDLLEVKICLVSMRVTIILSSGLSV